jgi:hypothetical protein
MFKKLMEWLQAPSDNRRPSCRQTARSPHSGSTPQREEHQSQM